ncbi:MAG TPA: sulfate/molybdate ABC transporter ATP-binding protein [Polyangiaceae bacterium]|nr:sulfate/molybdate ABC transporter ATP-binding protein [Polyangiaceae bacterium]
MSSSPPRDSAVSVRVEHATKRFGSATQAAAVNDVSFEAPPGAITALLGPSGSGKSTLLRMIAGLERPDAGRVFIGDKDVTHVSPRERKVGFVFQSYALFRHLTVFENVAFGLKLRKASRREIDARVRELLGLVQLEGYEKRFPSQLSGGQRQRVALARALATDPDVLLLDEPFGALDAKVRVELRRWMLELQDKTHTTTLLVTHDQEEAFELAQHVVLLSEGSLAQAGSPHDLYDGPVTPFVASFIGGASVLSGRVRSGQAWLGELPIRAPHGAPDGAPVRAYVRSGDVRIGRARDAEAPSARVGRLVRLGSKVQVSLLLPSGEALNLEIPRSELLELGIEAGDPVSVDLRDAKVFVGDYSI